MEVSEKSTKAEILKTHESLIKDIVIKAIENTSKIRMFTAKPEKEDN